MIVVLYSRLMGEDEEGTLGRLQTLRGPVRSLLAEHGGHIVKTTGDGLIWINAVRGCLLHWAISSIPEEVSLSNTGPNLARFSFRRLSSDSGGPRT